MFINRGLTSLENKMRKSSFFSSTGLGLPLVMPREHETEGKADSACNSKLSEKLLITHLSSFLCVTFNLLSKTTGLPVSDSSPK